ncbi:aquaporin [bacterium]|jgi:glycerol uptake facilitator-like aquaporin|nr:aquaporin [bacterium]|tara:strand:- start:117 stop:743 length:627 start_codon:yes stop_codon:yes gene_type:complete
MNKYIAEFYGTFLLLLSIVGTAHMMTSMNSPEYITLFAISIAAGSILFCNISLFMKVSGAHFNPAVSLMMLLRGNINIKDFSLYSIMQILGGISAVLCVHIMFGENPVGISQIDRSSTNILLGEFIATLGLLIVIIHGDRFSPSNIPVLVGAYILSAIFFTSSTCFANPAVTIARLFTDSGVGINLSSVALFLIVEILAVFVVSKSIE